MKTFIVIAISFLALVSAEEPNLFSQQANFVLSKSTEVKQAAFLDLQIKQENAQESDLADIDVSQVANKFKQEIEDLKYNLTQIILNSEDEAKKAIVQFEQCIQEEKVVDTVFKELLIWTAQQCSLDSLDDLVEKLISYSVDWIKNISENCVTIDDEIKAKIHYVFEKVADDSGLVDDDSGLVDDDDEVHNEPTQMLDIGAFTELNLEQLLEEILGDLDQLEEKIKNHIAEIRNSLHQEVAELCSQAYDLLVKLATSAAQKQQ